MKKLIGCPTGEWAKKLYTLDRFEKLSYFLDDEKGEFGYEGLKKQVYNYNYLREENIDEIVVIINDTRRYAEIKTKLEEYGLKENEHFFNGWKLDSNFYYKVYDDKNWIEFEEKDNYALARQRTGWQRRAKSLSQLIPYNVKTIMDIGCGEGGVKEFLPRNIKYYGVDYKKRTNDTIVCDINKDRLPQIDVDLYYMAGVIDYIEDMPKFIKQLNKAKYIILSKTRNERFIRLDDKVTDVGYMDFGIKPYYISNLITDMFEEGFVCKKMIWNYKERDEYYFLFENLSSLA